MNMYDFKRIYQERNCDLCVSASALVYLSLARGEAAGYPPLSGETGPGALILMILDTRRELGSSEAEWNRVPRGYRSLKGPRTGQGTLSCPC